MADYINATEYQYLATKYGKMLSKLKDSSVYLYDAVTYVCALDDILPSVDLVPDFYQTYVTNYTAMAPSAPFLGAVRALNTHVLNRGGYDTIDAYLANEATTGYKVPESWGELSAAAGQTINAKWLAADSTFI